ncbi:unnamed protein product, partial [Ectocarpus sp. 6 AP-2014]
MRWSKKGGTGKNENFHGGINRVVAGVARIGVEACDARLLQRVYRHNLDVDRKLGNTSEQSTRWPWRERVVNEAARAVLGSLPFPKAPPDSKIPTKDLEPIGFEYHTARKAAGRREAINAAAKIVAERRGNNPRSSPLTTAGSVAGAGPGAGAGAGPETAPLPLPLPTAGGRMGTAAAGAAGPGAGAAPLSAMTATGAAEAATRFVPPLWLRLPSTATGGAAVGGAAVGGGMMGVGASTTTADRRNAGGSFGQDTSFTNYGGGGKLHGRRPTMEGQKSLTPT